MLLPLLLNGILLEANDQSKTREALRLTFPVFFLLIIMILYESHWLFLLAEAQLMVHVYSWIQIYLRIPLCLSCLYTYLFNSCVFSASCQIITMSSFCKNAYSGGKRESHETNEPNPPPPSSGGVISTITLRTIRSTLDIFNHLAYMTLLIYIYAHITPPPSSPLLA